MAGREILESSRLAFQLSQSDLTREAIKMQGDLRKAIAEDISRAADGTRTLSGAVAVAIATGLSLVAARSTGATETWVLSLVAYVVAGYLVVVALSGWAYLRLQRDLRAEWRRRFYRFVEDGDYEAMVTKPARRSEWPYHLVASAALIVAFALGWMGSILLPTQPSPNKFSNEVSIEDSKKTLHNVTKSTTIDVAAPSSSIQVDSYPPSP